MSDKQDRIIITSFTDPVCTWCWGSGPVFRKLETHFPDQIEFRYVMGGLVEDVHTFGDPRNGIGGQGIDAFNRQVAEHWLEASGRHGMPVDAGRFNLFSDEFPSTYPASIAYKAAQMSDPDKADLFLYNVRVAAAAEARLVSHEDVLVSIASETGLDIGSFLAHLNDGSAERAFNGDRALMAALGVHGFPTFLVKYNGSQYMLRGFNDYETFVAVIGSATQGALRPVGVDATRENLLSFMGLHPRMAAEEIRQAFDLDDAQAVERFVSPLVESGELERQDAGNGWLVGLGAQGMACDVRTGVCS